MHRSVFLEEWWLDAATGGEWGAVTVERAGRIEGWLPYAWTRDMGFRQCGLPPLGRLIYPLIEVDALKRESRDRARFHVESELLSRLPGAACHQFILPPGEQNVLAWQAHGFTARVQHTFVVDAGVTDTGLWQQLRDKTRNQLRRAQEVHDVREVSASEFAAIYADQHGSAIDTAHRDRVARLAAAACSRGQGRAVAAMNRGGEARAAILFVTDASDSYFFLATRDAGRAEPGALAVLVWDGMVHAVGRGLRFDFDGVSSRSRLRFMQPFGGRIASRVIVERGSAAWEARRWLRRLRHRARSSRPVEQFW